MQESKGSKEDTQETGFQEQSIPLKGEEILSYIHQRQVGRPQSQEHWDRRNARHQQQRESHTTDTQAVQESIALIEPAQGWQSPVTVRTEPSLNLLQELTGREDSVGSQEAIRLIPDGQKCDEID